MAGKSLASLSLLLLLGFNPILRAQEAEEPEADFEPSGELAHNSEPASAWTGYYDIGSGIKPLVGIDVGYDHDTIGGFELSYGMGSASTLFLDALFKDFNLIQEHTASVRYYTPLVSTFRLAAGYGINSVRLNNYQNDCKSCDAIGHVTATTHGPEIALVNEWTVSDYDTFSIEWVGYIKTAGSSFSKGHKNNMTAEEDREYNKFVDDTEKKYGHKGGAFSRLLYFRFGTIF